MYFFRVGKLILTKARGSNVVGDAEDITGDYKHKDGSNAERLAVYNAIRGVDRYVKFKRNWLKIILKVQLSLYMCISDGNGDFEIGGGVLQMPDLD